VTETNFVSLSGEQIPILHTALKLTTQTGSRFRVNTVPSRQHVIFVKRTG
jgi:hypothetical protein